MNNNLILLLELNIVKDSVILSNEINKHLCGNPLIILLGHALRALRFVPPRFLSRHCDFHEERESATHHGAGRNDVKHSDQLGDIGDGDG